MLQDIEKIRESFPILASSVHGRPLVYLDNAATMQSPRRVMEAVESYYQTSHANVHRGIHYLSDLATAAMERARACVCEFTGAADPCEIVFTSGTTAGLNMAARMFREAILEEGDEVIVSGMEHHSNLIPWQKACARTGAVLRIIPVKDDGTLDMQEYAKLLGARTKLVSVCLVSNVLGTVNDVRSITKMAHDAGAFVMIDAAQGVRHGTLDARSMGCDMMCFSGHKMGAPTGTGVLYIKKEFAESLEPSEYGGGTVDTVTYDSAVFTDIPNRFEAGTPNIAGIIGLEAAIKYLQSVGIDEIAEYEAKLTKYCESGLEAMGAVDVLGCPANRAGAISFNLKSLHCYDTAALLDRLGIAVRSGHHCAQPLLTRFGLSGAVRVSPAFYNTSAEIDVFLNGIERIMAVGK